MKGGWVDPAGLPKGPNGRNVCRWCALEVPKRRRTFRSEWCVHEWRLRTDMGYPRARVFERDKGLYAGCGVDTESAWRQIRRLRGERRRQALAEWGLQGWKLRSLGESRREVWRHRGGASAGVDGDRGNRTGWRGRSRSTEKPLTAGWTAVRTVGGTLPRPRGSQPR